MLKNILYLLANYLTVYEYIRLSECNSKYYRIISQYHCYWKSLCHSLNFKYISCEQSKKYFLYRILIRTYLIESKGSEIYMNKKPSFNFLKWEFSNLKIQKPLFKLLESSKIRSNTFLSSAKHIKVNKIVIGTYHCLILTDMGQVYGCGSNEYNQIASKGKIFKKNYSHFVPIFSKMRNKPDLDFNVTDISVTNYHSIRVVNQKIILNGPNNKSMNIIGNNLSELSPFSDPENDLNVVYGMANGFCVYDGASQYLSIYSSNLFGVNQIGLIRFNAETGHPKKIQPIIYEDIHHVYILTSLNYFYRYDLNIPIGLTRLLMLPDNLKTDQIKDFDIYETFINNAYFQCFVIIDKHHRSWISGYHPKIHFSYPDMNFKPLYLKVADFYPDKVLINYHGIYMKGNGIKNYDSLKYF